MSAYDGLGGDWQCCQRCQGAYLGRDLPVNLVTGLQILGNFPCKGKV